ncbi:MAG: phosphatase PAP2 family protein [Ferrimicrobium sp.]
MSPTLTQFDRYVDSKFEPLRRSSTANRLFYLLSSLADHSLLWYVIALSDALRPRRQRYALRGALGIAAESLVVNLGIKSLFRRERPIDRSHVHPHPLRYPLTSSFPSGHATAAFAAATLLGDDSRSRPLLYGLATLVAISRIHVRIHHASDVLGGAAIGITIGMGLKTLVSLPRRHLSH